MHFNQSRSDSKSKECILIVENEEDYPQKLHHLLELEGAVFSSSYRQACKVTPSMKQGMIILSHCSFEQVNFVCTLAENIKIIVVTQSTELIERLNKEKINVFDFIYASDVNNRLISAVRKAKYVNQLEKELERNLAHDEFTDFVLSNNGAMKAVIQKIDSLALSDSNILIIGENGTGKAKLAKEIHARSFRFEQAFISVNCEHMPSALLEKELFGDQNGQIQNGLIQNSIVQEIKSKFEQAKFGTLFLEHADKLPLDLQNKIIKYFKKENTDIRIIASIEMELLNEELKKHFSLNFYHFISELNIILPALREREEDIYLLANKYLHRFNLQYGRNIKGFSNEAKKKLLSHAWPRNVEELESTIKSAVIMSESRLIQDTDLTIKKDTNKELHKLLNLKKVREKTEKQVIEQALSRVKGNVSQAANILGVSRPTLYSLLDKYSLN